MRTWWENFASDPFLFAQFDASIHTPREDDVIVPISLVKEKIQGAMDDGKEGMGVKQEVEGLFPVTPRILEFYCMKCQG